MSLFDSKIEPILSYGSVIWGFESNNNSILTKKLEEVNKESTREQVEKQLFRQVLEEPEVKMNLETIQQTGRKRENNKSRPILVQFSDYEDKERIIHSGKCNINSISIEDNFIQMPLKKFN